MNNPSPTPSSNPFASLLDAVDRASLKSRAKEERILREALPLVRDARSILRELTALVVSAPAHREASKQLAILEDGIEHVLVTPAE